MERRTTTPEPTETETETPRQSEEARTRERIRAAREHLKEATSTFKTEVERLQYSSRSPQFSEVPVRIALDEARVDLRVAARTATAKQERTLDALHDYVEFLERLLDVVPALERSMSSRPRATAFRDEYAEAASGLRRARSALEDVRSRLEPAQSGFRTVRQKLDDPAAVGLTSARDVLDRLKKRVADFETLYAGDRELKLGWKDYRTGLEDYYGNYTFLSASSFNKAKGHFGRANYIYGKRATNAPSTNGEPNRTIRVVGDGSAVVSYTFTVGGTLKAVSINSHDEVDGSAARGKVYGGSDEYAFAGAITNFEADGKLAVYVDGKQVDPDTLKPSLGRLFRRRECRSSYYRKAAEKMHKAALLDDESPEKADDYFDEAIAANNNAEDGCG